LLRRACGLNAPLRVFLTIPTSRNAARVEMRRIFGAFPESRGDLRLSCKGLTGRSENK